MWYAWADLRDYGGSRGLGPIKLLQMYHISATWRVGALLEAVGLVIRNYVRITRHCLTAIAQLCAAVQHTLNIITICATYAPAFLCSDRLFYCQVYYTKDTW